MLIFNTASRKKEFFEPIEKKKVKMYVCGPTVYDFIHIGNLRTFTTFDILRRYLKYKGYEVKYVQNITDVGHLLEGELEDKIILKAKKENMKPEDVARFYEEEYFKDIESFGIEKPDVSPRATEHIAAMQDLIKKLIEKGLAYEINGSVFYNVKKFEDYGKLSKLPLEQLKKGARLEIHPDKKNPEDFALWLKAPREHLMKWESPWGIGYPGWHIECSVMAMKNLGETIDIHGGGKDLIFPHHENEIAQSEGATGKKFANYWVHSEFILINGQKMAKSKGNFITAREAIKKYGTAPLRFLFLSTHYRTELNFTENAVLSAKEGVERIFEFVRKLNEIKEGGHENGNPDIKDMIVEFERKFETAMDDDLNTPLALAHLFDFIRSVNSLIDENAISKENAKEILRVINKIDEVFNLVKFAPTVSLPKEKIEEIEKLIAEREIARKNRNFKRSDEIRKILAEKGIIVEDTKEGPKWRMK